MLRLALSIAAISLCASAAHAETQPPLRVGTWGGAYEDTQRKVIYDPFTSRTGVAIQTVELDDPLVMLRNIVKGDGTDASVQILDLPDSVADAACDEKLLEPLDVAFFDRGSDGGSSGSDFMVPPTPCGIPSTLSSEVVVFKTDTFGAKTPSRVSDLFDVVNFPGKRAFKRDAMGTFEWALLADGVSPGEVYNVLATPEGVERVFAKLETIRNVAQWWDRGDVPLTWLARGEVVMAAAYSSWAYQAIVGEHLPLTIVWSGALTSANRWVIAKGQGGPPAAREFIKFASDTSRLAEFSRLTPYGAARNSAATVGVPEMSEYSPSTPEHMAASMPINAKFWREKGAPLRQRFEVWLQAVQVQAASQGAADKVPHQE